MQTAPPAPIPAILSPSLYAEALAILGLPQGHRLTVAEYAEACRIESEILA